MGLHGFKQLMTLFFEGDHYKHKTLISNLSGYRIAVDFMHFIISNYKAIVPGVIRSFQKDPEKFERLFTSDEELNEEMLKLIIRNVYYFIKKLLNKYIMPVFVIDGKSPKLKQNTKDSRRETHAKSKETAKDACKQGLLFMDSKQINDFIRNKSYSYMGTYDMNQKIIEFIKKLGIPVFYAPHEGEIFASIMAINGYVIGVCTKDRDPMAVGCPFIFECIDKEFFISISRADVLHGLNMNLQQFRDLCILLGTDFNVRLEGLTPKVAYNAIVLYGNLETFFEYHPNFKGKKLKNMSGEEVDYNEIRDILSYHELEERDINMSLEISRENLQELNREYSYLNIEIDSFFDLITYVHNNVKDVPVTEKIKNVAKGHLISRKKH